jgi:hypothetical protein
MAVEERGSAAVGTGLDDQTRPYRRDRLLDRPEVQDVLPHRVAEPGDIREVPSLLDQVEVEQPMDQTSSGSAVQRYKPVRDGSALSQDGASTS